MHFGGGLFGTTGHYMDVHYMDENYMDEKSSSFVCVGDSVVTLCCPA